MIELTGVSYRLRDSCIYLDSFKEFCIKSVVRKLILEIWQMVYYSEVAQAFGCVVPNCKRSPDAVNYQITVESHCGSALTEFLQRALILPMYCIKNEKLSRTSQS